MEMETPKEGGIALPGGSQQRWPGFARGHWRAGTAVTPSLCLTQLCAAPGVPADPEER